MSNYILDSQTLLFRIAIALFIGLLIGIDRDDSWRDRSLTSRSRFSFIKPGKPAVGLGGVRTYAVLSLLGVLLGTLYIADEQMLPLVIAGFIGVVGYISIAYFLNFFDRNTLGLTTEIGMLLLFVLTYTLGANLLEPKIVLGIAVVTSLISNLKVEFRRVIGSFTKKEILESIEFIAIAAVILPWLPNVNITLQQIVSVINLNVGSFGSLVILNPFQFWTVVVFISGLNFVGYFLAKTIRNSSSILLTAFLGGLVSSTSVTQFLSAKSNSAKTTESSKLLTAAVLLANMTSFIRIPLIALALNPQLFLAVAPTLLGLTIITITFALYLKSTSKTKENPVTIFVSPLALRPALTFGMLFLAVSIASNVGILFFGKEGFIATALIASLSGLDAVTIITAQAAPTIISLFVGKTLLISAVLTNLLFKLGVIAVYGEKRFKRQTFLWLGTVTVIGVLLLAVQYFL